MTFRPLVSHALHEIAVADGYPDVYDCICQLRPTAESIELRPVAVGPVRSCGFRPNLVPELPAGQVRWIA